MSIELQTTKNFIAEERTVLNITTAFNNRFNIIVSYFASSIYEIKTWRNR